VATSVFKEVEKRGWLRIQAKKNGSSSLHRKTFNRQSLIGGLQELPGKKAVTFVSERYLKTKKC
jgi:hypothetical protein